MKNTKKALIITGFNEKLHSLFPVITKKKTEELIILNSFGNLISKPYGGNMRSILLAIYCENIEEIYIIGERNSDISINKDELLTKIYEAGIPKETFETIEYIDVVEHNLIGWLIGPEDAEKIIQQNMDLIRNHPLMPNSIPVYGFIADSQTGVFVAVEKNDLKHAK